ncbi:MAG: VWA domain-containing protein [Bacteroidales bacterium]|nr:VWA domain-containing protein [Bacteroidales bacterium]
MRNLRKYIIASVTLVASVLSFGSVAMAQAVRYDKKISGPNEKGVFTLNLEAYATGSVTVETKPSDVILVLDRSGSMDDDMNGNETYYESNKRINILKEAVQGFVQNLKDTPVDAKYQDAYGGHRIAIVWFSGTPTFDRNNRENGVTNVVAENITGLNAFQNVSDLTTTKATTSGYRYQAAKVTLNGNDLLGVDANGGTYTDVAMQRAETILSGQNYSDKPNRSRLVVFFTDGEPGARGWEGGWVSDYTGRYYLNPGTATANGCISAANDIKNEYNATVYSVGLFNISDNTKNLTTTYLSYTSSDYTDKEEMPSNQSDYVPVSKDKSITVSSASELNNIFSSISQSAASAASGSSVLVDIVASNFNIPTNTNLGEVKVYQVPCTQASATSLISFSPRTATGDLAWKDITSSIGLDKSKQAQGEISVTGFDYASNWCGWDASANNGRGAAHGSKLVLEIPITVKDDIVGGPSMDTNAPGSKLIVKNKAGEVIEELEFISPIVKVPVTIWIKKEGLLSSTADNTVQGHEDNAVFTIRKTKFLGRVETDAEGKEIEGGKHIEYTYNNDTEYTIKGVKTKLVWTTFTKVSVNMKENEDGIVKISGLDPDYVYRIEEDAWAHLGYDFDPNATAQYTLVWDEKNKKYIEQTNPFIFSNTPKATAFYSEDVVRNVFNPGSARPTEPVEEPAQK